MAPGEVGVSLRGSVNAASGEWQLAHDSPGGLDSCGSRNNCLPKSCKGVRGAAAATDKPEADRQTQAITYKHRVFIIFFSLCMFD